MSLAIKVARSRRPTLPRAGVQRGDPGIFGFLKKAAGLATGIVGKLGIPLVSGVASGVSQVLTGPPKTPGMMVQETIPVQRVPGIVGAAQRILPGGRTGLEALLPPRSPFQAGGEAGIRETQEKKVFANLQLQNGGGCPKGFQLNKTDYFLRDGTFVPAGSRCVASRRRNPLNPRAFDRALGRISAAKRFGKRLGRVTIRKVCPERRTNLAHRTTYEPRRSTAWVVVAGSTRRPWISARSTAQRARSCETSRESW